VLINGMAKKLSYQITRTPDGGYRVYLGGNQYVQRATKLAIQNVIREHKLTLANRGRKLAAVPSDIVAGLMTLHHRCEAAGTTVAAAVDFWLPYYAKKIASIPLTDAIDQFIAHCRSQGMATSTVRERMYRLGLLKWVNEDNPEVTVFEACEVENLRGFIKDEVDRTSAASARNVWAVISAFGTWAKNRDFLPSNPCTVIEKPQPGELPVKVMAPDEAKDLLKIAVEHYDREILSYLVISLFAGIRPHEFVTELPKQAGWITLNWSAILNRAKLVKEKRLGKIKKARQVPVNETLASWIEYIQNKESGLLAGPVVRGYSFYQRFRRWKRAYYPEKMPAIEDDILRHSYGTYRVLKLGEVGVVALEMGNSESMVRHHYLDGERTEEDAQEYWKLTPDEILEDKPADKIKSKRKA
jgi:site-specific recombinase XerD